MKKVIWSIVLSWVCLAFAAAGIGTRARKVSLELEKLLKQFRKESLEASK